jgi:DNA-binding MarR family transcriptional regulator
MHTMFFSIKRVHLRVLHITRGLLRGIELTPARFDMMRIVELYADFGITQGRLVDVLGVSAATVSRMLASLEDLGFVTRKRLARDARCVLVAITELGLSTVRAARHKLVDKGVHERLALRGLAFEPRKAQPQLDVLQRFLMRLRRNYADPAPFAHPWTTKDRYPYVFHTLVDGKLTYDPAFC